MSNTLKEGAISLTDTRVTNAKERGSFEKKPAKVFRPEDGKTYRIRFMTQEVLMRRRHYNRQKKRYFRCLSYQGYCPVCVAASQKKKGFNRASETYGANIMVYETDDNGNIPTLPNGQPDYSRVNADIYFWAFGSDKFVQLRDIINEWGPITEYDLKVTCTDSQFQNLTITPAKGCIYAANLDFKALMDEKYETDKYPLDKFLCKEITLNEMLEAFGIPESFVPQNILQQMGEGQTKAQDVAQNTQTTQNTQQYQAPPQQAPNSSNSPNQGDFGSPEIDQSDLFADLSDLTDIL